MLVGDPHDRSHGRNRPGRDAGPAALAGPLDQHQDHRAVAASETGHRIEVAGLPTVLTKVQYLPPPDFEAKTFADFMVLGMIMTALPAVNAIPAVVAAPHGIVTYTDLPLTLPRGWAAVGR